MGNCISQNDNLSQNGHYNHNNHNGGYIIKQNPINNKEFTSIATANNIISSAIDPKIIHTKELINAIQTRQINLTLNENNNTKINQHQIIQPILQQQMFELNNSNKPEEKGNYIVMFDYEKATKDDITIKKNDYLFVIDKSHSDWWLAKNLRTLETGYVPHNYITAVDNLEIKE